jgi:hypothetical protein
VLTRREAVKDLFELPRLPLGHTVAGVTTELAGYLVMAATSAGRGNIGDSGVGDGPVDGSDKRGRNRGVRWCVNWGSGLLVDLVRGVNDDSVVGRGVRNVGGSLVRKPLMTRRDDCGGRYKSQ